MEELEDAVEPTVRALDSVVALIDRSKETSVPLKGSVWDLVAGNVAGAEKFESTVRDLDDELHDWKDETERLNESLREMSEELEAADEDADYDALADEFAEAMEAMKALEERSERLETRLRDAAGKSGEVARKAGGVPVLGDEIADRFESLSARLSKTAEKVDGKTVRPPDVIEVRPVRSGTDEEG